MQVAWIDGPAARADTVTVLIGDCVQCYRTALDHLAYDLATTFTPHLSDHLKGKSEYPVLIDAHIADHVLPALVGFLDEPDPAAA